MGLEANERRESGFTGQNESARIAGRWIVRGPTLRAAGGQWRRNSYKHTLLRKGSSNYEFLSREDLEDF